MSLNKDCKTFIDLMLIAGIHHKRLLLHAPRRCCHILYLLLGRGLRCVGEDSDLIAVGTNSRRISNRFAVSSALILTTAVVLPPGCLKLATKPSLTGSPPPWKTIGILSVAAFAAFHTAGSGSIQV